MTESRTGYREEATINLTTTAAKAKMGLLAPYLEYSVKHIA
jgi:hypothetical protein